MAKLLTDYRYTNIFTLIRNNEEIKYSFGNHKCSIIQHGESWYIKAQPLNNTLPQFVQINEFEVTILSEKLQIVDNWIEFVNNLPENGAMGGAPGPSPTVEERDELLLIQLRDRM
jgi:hypothetical protein